jgi:hypothetical protein
MLRRRTLMDPGCFVRELLVGFYYCHVIVLNMRRIKASITRDNLGRVRQRRFFLPFHFSLSSDCSVDRGHTKHHTLSLGSTTCRFI